MTASRIIERPFNPVVSCGGQTGERRIRCMPEITVRLVGGAVQPLPHILHAWCALQSYRPSFFTPLPPAVRCAGAVARTREAARRRSSKAQ